MKLIFISIITILISSCAAFAPETREATDRMINGNVSEKFKIGFHHGCKSGYNKAGNPYNSYIKYRKLYKNTLDADYKDGWDEGMDRCYESYRNTQRLLNR